MALMKLKDFYPDYKDNHDSDADIENFSVYDQSNEKVGSVTDILVDDTDGRFRYLAVDTGFWIFGKKVLLPIGLANINHADHRIDVNGLTKDQIQDLPNFDDLEKVDYDYEEQVRGTYRPLATPAVDTTTAATTGAAMGGTTANVAGTMPAYDRDTYSYDRDAALYSTNDRNQSLRLYEERLIANKQRQKTGEVVVGKHIETEQAHVSVPVEKERVVVERTTPTNAVVSDIGNDAFREGEVARMEVYEETPDIRKETILREEVKVKKVVDRDTVNADETLRREELDLDTEGRPVIDKNL
ncbi:MAG TPA: DUF2382 domain-containing protein [Trichocoleus sp.]|jgi:uncharacterized protein (TIGR02271 family)